MGKGKFSSWKPRKAKAKAKNKKKEFRPFKKPIESSSTNGNNRSTPLYIKKKLAGSRLWMQFDSIGRSELFECNKSTIINRVSIPARDFRILGPVFSPSSGITPRERAMIINLAFIKAIVTAEEVLLLDPLSQEVLLFVNQLRTQLPLRKPCTTLEPGVKDMEAKGKRSLIGQSLPVSEDTECLQSELPFEFHVLEIALEVVCSYLNSSVVNLEICAYPALDELAKSISTKNLERVRSLKGTLTHLLASVQKVKDEIEHLLDDSEDMAQLYLTRKMIQNFQYKALEAGASDSAITFPTNLQPLGSSIHSNMSFGTSIMYVGNDVEDLEMLLEAYFMQLEGTHNKILSVREYIDDTEDYVIIQLDHHRNELLRLQLIMIIASFAIGIEALICASFGMNIPCQLYEIEGIFGPIIGGTLLASFVIFLAMLARWRKPLGS
ncbi:hypothetical protein AAC387_Pa04g2676 [Persea americana]